MLLNSNPSSFFIPDFVEIQRKSFFDLLEKGLINEIKKRNFISTPNNDVQLIFYPDYYQLNPPEWTPKQAILKSKSYTCRLYVPAQLINNLTKKINLQWVLLGNLPLMTKRGHFIINGSPRIIINQMVRSPGIYYQETIDKNKKRSYYADLISHRGTWLRLETDKKQRVWARMKKTPKVSILIFLQSFGLTKERVFQSIHYSNFLKNSFLKQNHPISTEQALIALYSKTHPKKDKTEVTPEMGHKFLFRKFMNPRTYDLGKLGRLQLNKKLGLSVPLSIYTLTPQDILFAVDYLIKLEHGVGSIDDIDHLKNRRVRASGELVQNQLGTGLIRLEKMIREKLKKPKKNLTIRSLITTKPVNGALREFFGSSPLSQFMDQTNPLAEITHKRRLSSLGPGGVSRETAGMAVRGIHPSHYGRICPIETPEGPNAGLVNSITTYARINSEGFLETPFYNVSQGQIQKKQSPIFFSAEHEENLNVAPGDLKSNILNFLPKNLIPIRNSDEFKLVSRDQVHYIAISPIQMISIATSLIPFLEHDDANRALMGSNMQRQAVPLIAPERPVIGTGLEARVVSDSGHIIQAESSGFVSYVSGDKIIIQTFFPLKFNSPEISSYRKSFDSRMFTQKERRRSSFDSRMITHDSNRVLAQEGKTKKFDSNRVLIQEDLKNLRFSESLDSLKFSNNNLFWNQYDLSKRATSRNKREFLVFNFKYKIQNHFVASIRTGELFSLLMCQTKNILNFSNTLFYREINKPSLLVSKNALQINLSWFPSNTDCLIHPKEEFLDSNTMLDPYGTIDSNRVLAQEGNGRPFGIQEANQYEFLFKTKKAQIGNNYTNLARLEQSSRPRGEFGISKKKFVNRLIILNSQKTYFQSLIKTFLFDFFNKKITSFYLRSWNSFFYLFYSEKNSFFFCPINENFKYYSSTIDSNRVLAQEENGRKSIRESFLFQLDYFFLGSRNNKKSKNFLDSRSFKFPMVPSTIIKRSPILVAPKGSTISLLGENSVRVNGIIRVENSVGANVFVINKNLVGIKSNSKIQTIRNKFILIRECSSMRKSISSNSLSSMSLLAQQKLQKYGAFFNKKVNFKTDNSLSILPAQMVESKRQIFNLTTKTRTQFEDSLELENSKKFFNSKITNPNKFYWFDSKRVLAQEKKDLSSSIVSKEVRIRDSVWQSLRSLKGMSIQNSNATKIKKLFDVLPHSSLTSIRESLVTSPSTYNSIVYNLQNYQRSNQDTCLTQNPVVYEGEWIQKGDLLADGAASVKGELALGKNILIGYMPWEGYNFEDAILINERLIYDDIYTSIHIERYEVEIRDTKFGVEQITNQIPEIDILEISHLDNNGISKIGTWVKEADILVGKVTPIQKKLLSPHEKLLYDIVGKDIPTTRDTSLRLPKSVEGRVVDIQVLETENIPPEIAFEGPGRVHIYVAEKRKIQVGDKMAGRHGNKGIVSKILPRQDMPYLPDGTPIDMVLNPLGVPSRMNVGQVFECLLGLAGKYLGQQFKIVPFDEIYGPEASRSLVYSKLFEASLKTGQDWLFHPNFPGKTKLFDGRTGDCFDQAVTIGQAYMLKLVHLVDEKIHARSTGPYSLVTQQPLRGRSKHGGQRLGEMEVWALEGFGAAYTLQELLTVKSDDMKGRHQVMDAILNNKTISLGTPESFKVLIRELQSLCLDVGVYSIDSTGHRKQIDVMKLP